MGGARQCFTSVHSLKTSLIFYQDYMYTSKTLTLEVDSADSIMIVKQMIKDIENIPPVQQSLVFTGKQVENSLTLIMIRFTGVSNPFRIRLSMLHASLCTAKTKRGTGGVR